MTEEQMMERLRLWREAREARRAGDSETALEKINAANRIYRRAMGDPTVDLRSVRLGRAKRRV
jgi:hypothetical protein